MGDNCDDDMDNDTMQNIYDNCPTVPNPHKSNVVNNGIGDLCDNCATIPNPSQEERNNDLVGNACDSDIDGDNDGIQGSENNCTMVGKVVYFTATFPFLVLIVLFIRGITLPGAANGIIYYLNPDWSRLRDIKVWSDGALQVFFSLGPGWGGIVNMASFNNFRNNIKKDVLLIPIINCSTSIFAGFVVFSVLGYLSHQTGIPIDNVATNGPGLVFVTYPQAIAMLPWPHLWAILFFLMIFFLGLDTVFVQIETIATCILDEIPRIRKYSYLVPIVLCCSMFLVSVLMITNGGIYILHLLDWYSTSLPLILICFVEVVMVSWIYGIRNFVNDIFFMVGSRPNAILPFCLKYITPFVLISLFLTSVTFNGRITYGGIEYPNWAVGLGWLSCAVSIVFIPLYMQYIFFFKTGSLVQNFKNQLKPQKWAPAKKEFRQEYEKFKNSLMKTSISEVQTMMLNGHCGQIQQVSV